MRTKLYSSKDLIIGVFIISLILGFVFAIIFVPSFSDAYESDLISYLTGARILAVGKSHEIYSLGTQRFYQMEILDPHTIGNPNPFVNPPLLAVFFIPLSFIPFLSAYKIYGLILFLMVIVISAFSSKIFSNLKGSLWLLLPFFFYPSLGAVLAGQVTPFLVLCFLAIYYFLLKKKYFWVGFLSGLLLLKIQYTILIPYLFVLIKDKKEYIKGLLISAFTVFISSSMLSGWGIWFDYYHTIAAVQNPEYRMGVWNMFTLHSSLMQMKQFAFLSYNQIFIVNILFYFVSIGMFYLFIKYIGQERLFAASIILTLVFCVHGVNYDLSLLLLPIFILLNDIKGNLTKKRKTSFADFLAILLLVVSPVFYPLGMSVIIPFLYIFTMLVVIYGVKFEKKLRFS